MPDENEALPPKTHNIAMERLKSIIERYERLDEEKKALGSDQRDILLEAKSAGFDPKIIREVLRLRKMDANELEEREMLIATYTHALGM